VIRTNGSATTTTATSPKDSTSAKTRTKPRAPQKSKRPGAGLTGSPEGKRKASVILEVLGGLRTPTSASTVLGISIQAYYLLEIRALQGLVAAVDAPPGRGGRPSPDGPLRRAVADRDRLERELLRAQALLRVAQRSIGLPPPQPTPKASKGAKGKSKATRKPTIRGRRAAQALRDAASEPDPETPPSDIEITPPTTPV
jgi:hypothetical protein